ncbi:hypothetical protein E6P09_11605 [Haloferax mediterranei ATCC 33500]|uniref:DUF8173 domain-containing protein n=1 Tax=Haloferax mediterranei (strain ATCC 33500 / DSM 1411 / JCM 8866 / NBRC 14739 / NCIMB 2177 / R-4) TaxID=523841 RepID=M0J7Q7_HALMT|nr:hypothetical protein [Haloferax mediterranei]AHZ21227.1 hypothetical protein BM92_00525 [Haloferax mediterranei ATCC 33500]EMA04388.1 hypothetical protein C439_01897 [Haloferax mediterranei ATCC 33500]MDX5989527.1 hypothetical protein [Haloferax mediterranei ATCC 33500]QCQ75884.1 hypothetical protein E6P09_11605 [Haloferax mediterranei ATCC 33500]
MVPPRKSLPTLLSLLGVLALAGTAAAQNFGSTPEISPMARAGVNFAINLVVGGILVAAAPEYTRGSIAEVRSAPGRSIAWGFGILVAVVIGIIASSLIPLLGILLVLLESLAFVILIVVGSAVATVLFGSIVVTPVTGRSPSLGVALVVGAVGTAFLSIIPVFGALVLFIVNLLGLGVVSRNAYLSLS